MYSIEKYILFIILSVISVLSHRATAIVIVVVLLCDFVFRRLSFSKFLCLLLSLSAFLTFFICFCLDDEIINHHKILHSQATILGGMWNELPFVICILIVARIHNIVLSVRPYVCNDIKYRYLFCSSMSVVLFLGGGLLADLYSKICRGYAIDLDGVYYILLYNYTNKAI